MIFGIPLQTIGCFITAAILILVYTFKGPTRYVSYKCDENCHGSNDGYTYADLTALEGVHALERRVSKIEYRLAKSIGNYEGNGYLDGEVIMSDEKDK